MTTLSRLRREKELLSNDKDLKIVSSDDYSIIVKYMEFFFFFEFNDRYPFSPPILFTVNSNTFELITRDDYKKLPLFGEEWTPTETAISIVNSIYNNFLVNGNIKSSIVFFNHDSFDHDKIPFIDKLHSLIQNGELSSESKINYFVKSKKHGINEINIIIETNIDDLIVNYWKEKVKFVIEFNKRLNEEFIGITGFDYEKDNIEYTNDFYDKPTLSKLDILKQIYNNSKMTSLDNGSKMISLDNNSKTKDLENSKMISLDNGSKTKNLDNSKMISLNNMSKTKNF